MAFEKVNPDRYVKDLYVRSEQYAQGVRAIYLDYIDRITKLVNSYPGMKSKKTFSFADNSKLNNEVNSLLKEMYAKVYIQIKKGIEAEWAMANSANDNLVKAVFGPKAMEKNHFARFFDRNGKAMDAFINRREGKEGLNLSDRVWRYAGQLKDEMDLALAVSIGAGKSSGEISRDVRMFLNEPEKLFRRVRDEKGILHLSKAAKTFHPGRGVYRSSYKNAMRVARSETNMAYKVADHVRRQQLDFVVGFEVKLSKMHHIRMPQGDICDHLKGKYDKTFVFKGWHTQCMCYTVSILLNDEELSKFQDAILAGEDTKGFNSINQVQGVPSGFIKWIAQNTDRGSGWSTQPYFIRDNFVSGRIDQGLKPEFIKPARIDNSPFSLNNDTRKLLSDMGVSVTGDNEDFNKIMSGFDINKFFSEFNAMIEKEGFELETKTLRIFGKSVKFKLQTKGYEASRVGDKRAVKGICLERSFNRNWGQLMVEHEYFDVDSKLQGSGFSKQVFQSLYRQYINSGVRYISVHANIDIGGYAWGRYGFSIKTSNVKNFPNSYERFNFRSLTDDELLDATKEIENRLNSHPSDEYFPMDLLANKPYGKKLLKGSDWIGRIDLEENDQKKVFENYLFNRSSK